MCTACCTRARHHYGCKQRAPVHALRAIASCMQAGSAAAALQRARDDAQAALAAAARAAAAQAAGEAAASARAAAAQKAAEARRRREPDAQALAHVQRTLALAQALNQARCTGPGAFCCLYCRSVLCHDLALLQVNDVQAHAIKKSNCAVGVTAGLCVS